MYMPFSLLTDMVVICGGARRTRPAGALAAMGPSAGLRRARRAGAPATVGRAVLRAVRELLARLPTVALVHAAPVRSLVWTLALACAVLTRSPRSPSDVVRCMACGPRECACCW